MSAFCDDLARRARPVDQGRDGPLFGCTFAAKDVFDISGYITGAGNPDWKRTHAPAEKTASAVTLLEHAGAKLVAKTHTDELAFSLNGENAHYGTPINPRAAGRVPGGSSSGSASAVAAGVVDTALGTDTAGSIRIPASYCGLWGMRPSHGAVPMDGVVPLAPEFDTVGWFARDPATLQRVGKVLLGDGAALVRTTCVVFPNDAFAQAMPEVTAALAPTLAHLRACIARSTDVVLAREGLDEWASVFRVLQGRQVWQTHGDWIRAVQPELGAGIRQRVEWCESISDGEVQEARSRISGIRARLTEMLPPGSVLCLPTAPCIAPPLRSSQTELEHLRARIVRLTCIAGLGALPQISMPVAQLHGCPVGLSLIAPYGADHELLRFAVELSQARA